MTVHYNHLPNQRCAGLTNFSGRTRTSAQTIVAPCEVKDWPHQSAPTQNKNSRIAWRRESTSIYNHRRQPHTPWSSETATSRGRPRDNLTARPETTGMTTSCISARAKPSPSDPAEYIDPSYVKRKKERVQYRTVKPEVRTTIEVRICLIESCVLFQEQKYQIYNDKNIYNLPQNLHGKINIYMLTWLHVYIILYMMNIFVFTW